MKARRIWLIALLVLAALFRPSTQTPVEAADLPFGDGSDGPVTFSSNTQFNPPVDGAVTSGSGSTLTVASPSGVFQPGQKILVYQVIGVGAGAWELNSVQSYALGTLVTGSPLANSYGSPAEVVVVPQYTDVTVDAGVTVSTKPWDGTVGGMMAFFASGTVTINGAISGDAAGSRGATAAACCGRGKAGEGTLGGLNSDNNPNGNGGGPGQDFQNGSAGGGGNGSAGSDGGFGAGHAGAQGKGGLTAGTSDLTTMVFGGGGGNTQEVGGLTTGGSGGGIVVLGGANIVVGAAGTIRSNGGAGNHSPDNQPGSGGGAGGSILIRTQSAAFGAGLIAATGGAGGAGTSSAGGAGGVGRIRVEYCGTISGGTANPPASVAQFSVANDVDCDGYQDPQQTLHFGPANTDFIKDNCPSISNPSQTNTDGNFSDNSPPYVEAVDDKTNPNSDALGDACDPNDDNDGLTDALETGTLLDFQAVCPTASAVTNALLLDSDNDHITDGAECAMGSDPMNIASKPAIPSTLLTCVGPLCDPDKDQLSNAFEALLGTNPNSSDSDGDGVPDGIEYKGWGSNPLVIDTDGDGIRDRCEVASVNADTIVNSGDQAALATEIVRAVPVTAKLPNFDMNRDTVYNSGDQALMATAIGPGKCP